MYTVQAMHFFWLSRSLPGVRLRDLTIRRMCALRACARRYVLSGANLANAIKCLPNSGIGQ